MRSGLFLLLPLAAVLIISGCVSDTGSVGETDNEENTDLTPGDSRPVNKNNDCEPLNEECSVIKDSSKHRGGKK